MKTFYLTVASFCIKIQFFPTVRIYFQQRLIYDVKEMYKQNLQNSSFKIPDYTISIFDSVPKMLVKKTAYKTSLYIGMYEMNKNSSLRTTYLISRNQFQMILYTVIQNLLARQRGFILHASASLVKNKAFLFVGPPNAGKSTAMSLLHPYFPALADDSVILRKEHNTYFCYQTPFIEKNYWIKKRVRRYNISKLCFLRKTTSFAIKKIANKAMLITRIGKQLWTTNTWRTNQMTTLCEFVNTFDEFYWLSFAPDIKKMRRFITGI